MSPLLAMPCEPLGDFVMPNLPVSDDDEAGTVEPVVYFLRNLRAFREHLDLDKSRMAELLGYSTASPYVRLENYLELKHKYETGKAKKPAYAPSITRMWEICTFLGIDFYDMISCELDFSRFDGPGYLLKLSKKQSPVATYAKRVNKKSSDDN